VQAAKPYKPPEFDPSDFWRKRFVFEMPPATIEYSVTAAASLARYYLQRGRSVGLAYADQTVRILPSDRGGRQLGKILEALALVRAEGDMPLQGIVEAQARHLPRGSTVVLITPSTADSVYRTIDLLVRRGLRPVAVLIDAVTFGGYLSTQRVAESLKMMNVPYCQIQEGQDLGVVLSTTVGKPNWT